MTKPTTPTDGRCLLCQEQLEPDDLTFGFTHVQCIRRALCAHDPAIDTCRCGPEHVNGHLGADD